MYSNNKIYFQNWNLCMPSLRIATWMKNYWFNVFVLPFFRTLSNVFMNAPTRRYMKCKFSIYHHVVGAHSLYVRHSFVPFVHHFLYRRPNHAVRLSKYNFSFFLHDRPNGTSNRVWSSASSMLCIWSAWKKKKIAQHQVNTFFFLNHF